MEKIDHRPGDPEVGAPVMDLKNNKRGSVLGKARIAPGTSERKFPVMWARGGYTWLADSEIKALAAEDSDEPKAQ